MKLSFNISKKYNHFFFVQTLADWHFSCRQEYIDDWLAKTGPLTGNEKNSLDAFRVMLQKHGFGELKNSQAANVFDFFMRFDEFTDKSVFSADEINIYLAAMDALETRFEKIWAMGQNGLVQAKKLLENVFDRDKDMISGDLKKLFANHIDLDRSLEVILLLSTEDSGAGAGGANNGPNIITLECSGTHAADLGYLLSTLWHEMIHLIMADYISEAATQMEINETAIVASIQVEKADFKYFEELVAFSLFSPMSFLTRKYFHTDLSGKLQSAVSKNDIQWLLHAKYVFVMYLIYLNGQYLEESLKGDRSIPPEEMAKAFIENHQVVDDYFRDNGARPEWLSY
ncbi:MAG: hypothetical protein WCG48_02605 [Candidatus Berkelbacteria bacterium]